MQLRSFCPYARSATCSPKERSSSDSNLSLLTTVFIGGGEFVAVVRTAGGVGSFMVVILLKKS
jgi:hypothetical protein